MLAMTDQLLEVKALINERNSAAARAGAGDSRGRNAAPAEAETPAVAKSEGADPAGGPGAGADDRSGGAFADVADEKARAVMKVLAELHPDARVELDHKNDFELLVATILSAQTTDEAVNRVTADLFERFPTPESFLTADEDEVAGYLRTIGLFRSKARYILATSRILVEDYGGRVPGTREELMKLPGVGRKTANVVLSNAFGVPALAVDTHVFRVARRIGLARGSTTDQVERELMELVPDHYWYPLHHQLIFHGRRVCQARRPDCDNCPVLPWCDYGREVQEVADK